MRQGSRDAEAASVVTQRCLCICADDFGLHAGVNAGVLALIDAGVVNATGCMVRRSAWSEGAPALRDIDVSRCDVGLHLDLTAPRDGGLGERSLVPLLLASYADLLPRVPLQREIRSQLGRFEDAMGRTPAFVDGHRHVHQLPMVRDLLLDELAARYERKLPWIRSTAAPREGSGGSSGSGRGVWPGKAEVIEALGDGALRRRARARGFQMNRALLGVRDFAESVEGYRRRLNEWLANGQGGDVLMCHPALPTNAAAAAADRIGAARLIEYAALRETGLLAKMRAMQVVLLPLSQYLKAGAVATRAVRASAQTE